MASGSKNINYKTLSDEENKFVIPEHHLQQQEEQQQNDNEATNNDEDTPRNSGVLLHTVPEINRSRWNHIEDLDSFFTRMYHYHQKHGFVIIVLDEIFQLIQFAFVIWLITFTVHCINHDILFGNELPASNHTKISISDVIIPMDECVDNFGGLTVLVLFIASIYLLIRSVKVLYHLCQYWDIKKFYNTALHIDDSNLDNITWHEIKKKVREVQAEQHMCIDKDHLTDLDIYHRILRFKNYLVALMNKNLLPVRFNVPLCGEMVVLSRGLLFNIDLILFRSPGSPFQNNWQLRDDYSIRGNQVELAKRLSNLIFWIAIANFLLAPFIFVWQLILFSFTYADILKKEPGAFGMRTWSNYGRLYLRHFNELDHELDARLNRAYEYANRYLNSFSSPLMAVLAKNILFISGGILLLLLALGIYDEYVFQVEHMLTIMTVLSVIGLICRNMIPDENMIWCPEQLMTAILAHVHYLPSNWKNQAHTSLVQKEFGNFFQFKAAYYLNEIISPLITPFQLLFVFRPKALEIVKFFRSFTVSVRGVGNVCSFAQMDVRKHGNPEWQMDVSTTSLHQSENMAAATTNGKTELSLLHFTLTNPEWQMPPEALDFVKAVRQTALTDLSKAVAVGGVAATTKQKRDFANLNPLTESLLSFGTIQDEYSSVAKSLLFRHNAHTIPKNAEGEPSMAGQQCQCYFEQMLQQSLGAEHSHLRDNLPAPSKKMKRLRVSKLEGSIDGPSQQQSLIYSLYGPDSLWDNKPNDMTVADMCLSALYMHEMHHKVKKSSAGEEHCTEVVEEGNTRPRNVVFTDTIVTSSSAVETTPLLGLQS
ncbi:autophagy-related protein 9A [Lucilia sericata]|uniref:autophagy-related protein 9A n=1 Tax=Lucilia sericata TaxID=13632 RepID=UPI0018A81E48|nr:autophagy-related protein 9A [Lucilia sericata]